MPRKTTGRTARTVGVSLFPQSRDWSIERAGRAGLSFSSYIATLVDGDRRLNLLPEILQSRLEDAPAKKGGAR
jgi:hypothetical protein